MSDNFYRTSRPAMGGILTIALYGSDERQAGRAADRVFAEVERVERLLSFFDAKSEISRINRLAGRGPVESDPEVVRLISLAIEWSRGTGGTFDITMAPLKRLWGFLDPNGLAAVPSRREIEATLGRVGYHRVLVDPSRCTIQFTVDGAEIDLGAVGKGYGIDRAVDVLEREGIARAWVSFGSTAYALGSPPGGAGWKIGVQDPKNPNREIASVTLMNRAVSTSGIYQQFQTQAGRTFAHVIDPRSGYPIEGISSASVVCPRAAAADALSTAALVLGTGEDVTLLEDMGCEGVCVVPGEEGRRMEVRRFSRSAPIFEAGVIVGEVAGQVDRRGFLKRAAAFLALLLLGRDRLIADVESDAEDSLKEFLPKADSIEKKSIRLTPEQMESARRYLGMEFSEDTYTFLSALHEGKPIGHAVILEVLGKERPITYLIAADEEGRVVGIEVLAYRESIGGEIRSHRFLGQFKGKTVDSPMRLGRDIQGITGATISSRSTRTAVRKGLALLGVVYGDL